MSSRSTMVAALQYERVTQQIYVNLVLPAAGTEASLGAGRTVVRGDPLTRGLLPGECSLHDA